MNGVQISILLGIFIILELAWMCVRVIEDLFEAKIQRKVGKGDSLYQRFAYFLDQEKLFWKQQVLKQRTDLILFLVFGLGLFLFGRDQESTQTIKEIFYPLSYGIVFYLIYEFLEYFEEFQHLKKQEIAGAESVGEEVKTYQRIHKKLLLSLPGLFIFSGLMNIEDAGFIKKTILYALLVGMGMVRYEIKPFNWSKESQKGFLQGLLKRRFFFWIQLCTAWIYRGGLVLNTLTGLLAAVIIFTFVSAIPGIKDRWVEKITVQMILGITLVILMIQGVWR